MPTATSPRQQWQHPQCRFERIGISILAPNPTIKSIGHEPSPAKKKVGHALPPPRSCSGHSKLSFLKAFVQDGLQEAFGIDFEAIWERLSVREEFGEILERFE